MPNKVKKLSDLITAYSDKLQLFERSGTLEIYSAWASIVGEKIASHCKLIDIEHQTALIETDHTGWCQQLLLNKKKIIRNFQKRYPELEVKNISIIVSAAMSDTSTKNIHNQIISIQALPQSKTEEAAVSGISKKELPIEICDLLERLRISITENEKKSG